MVNDEFYTPAKTIIDELKYYGYDGLFKGKTIYLPCDYDATLPYIKKEIKRITHVEGALGIELTSDVVIYKVIPIYDWKFVGLSHNTLRGAAGGAVLCAEFLTAKKYITKRI